MRSTPRIDRVRPQGILVLVPRDGEKPCDEVGVVGEAMHVSRCREPTVLKQIFGNVAAPREMDEKAPYPLAVLPVKLVECSRMPLFEADQQIGIGRIGVHAPS
jgi:hypothetical protein